MAKSYFEFEALPQWTDTTNRAVGPIQQTGVRGTLPVVPTDLNSIWVDGFTGSDANPGTEASPKLTVNGAHAALGVIKNIVIFSVGGTVAIADLTASIALTAAQSIMALDGTHATITSDGFNITLGDGCVINGCALVAEDTVGGNLVMAATVTAAEVQNCFLHKWLFTQSVANMKITISNTAFSFTRTSSTYMALDKDNTTSEIEFNNCVMDYPDNLAVIEPLAAGLPVEKFFIQALGLDVANRVWAPIVFNQCVIKNWRTIMAGATNAFEMEITVEMNGCVVIGADYIVTMSYVSTNVSATLDANYCILGASLGTAAFISNDITANTGSATATILNPLPALPSLFLDEEYQNRLAGSEATSYVAGGATQVQLFCRGYQLQEIGRMGLTGGRFKINSPLMDAYVAGPGDAAPWDDTMAFSAWSFGSSGTFSVQIPGVTVPRKSINNRTLADVNGNLHKNYDARRRMWALEFSGALIGNDNLNLMELLVGQNGSIRFYRLGESGNEFSGNATSGAFSASGLDLTATFAGSLVADHWAGWWARVDDGSEARDYLITGNTDKVLELSDPLGVGFFANGNYEFTVPYMLVKTPQESVDRTANNPYRDEEGSRFEEDIALDTQGGWYTGTLELQEERTISENTTGGKQ